MTKLVKLINQLTSDLKQFGDIIEQAQPHQSQFTELFFKHKENDLITNIESQTAIKQSYLDQGADKKISQAYQDLTLIDGLSGKYARRYPGCIRFSHQQARKYQLDALVEGINAVKNQIKVFVTDNYHDRFTRFDALHDALPGVMTLHLYRQIHLIEKDVQKVRFHWVNKANLQKVNKQQLVAKLNAEAQTSEQLYIKQLLNKVVSVKESKLRYRRPVSIQPVSNIWFADKSRLTKTAALPMVIISDQHCQIYPLNQLKPITRQARSDQSHNAVLGNYHGVNIEMIKN
ncbi:DNA replication terminus site-binding protein [Paraferrimonas sp. SM1919]|uniref:DNA replication terminus site-binding protein n=1 Tax=Paraferrimonas sp. SM1919 TaxID=2662263 RepID=UPI0013D18CFF|nr:DNA replication terminus site-binding protein [Paraferrimonas sp. SM1919]